MPRDKKTFALRPYLQIVAGLGLLVALVLDPGCRANHDVVIQEATPIRPSPPHVKQVSTVDGRATTGSMNAVEPHGTPTQVASAKADSAPPTVVAPAVPPFESLLATDPIAALRHLHAEARDANKEYTCLFTRQERLSSGVGPDQDIRVKFRPNPHSVQMEFVRNPNLVKRVIYVDGRWLDESASDPQLRDQALVQPYGLAGVLIKSLKQPIRGTMAKRSGRRTIDQFGFVNALDLIATYCEKADAEGTLTLTYEGVAEFEGRRVWVLKRVLPYTGPDGKYPDRVAIFYIDQEYRVPIAVHTYSDDAARPEDLLGKYEYREINFSPGLTDADFDPSTYGL